MHTHTNIHAYTHTYTHTHTHTHRHTHTHTHTTNQDPVVASLTPPVSTPSGSSTSSTITPDAEEGVQEDFFALSFTAALPEFAASPVPLVVVVDTVVDECFVADGADDDAEVDAEEDAASPPLAR